MTTKTLLHSGNIILMGFAGFILMMCVLIFLALKEDIPMVSTDYYQKELEYQHKIDAAHNASGISDQLTLSLGGGQVNLQLPVAGVKKDSKGTVYFYSSSDPALDRSFSLETDDAGNMSVPLAVLPGKQYTVQVSFTDKGLDYYREWKIDLNN